MNRLLPKMRWLFPLLLLTGGALSLEQASAGCEPCRAIEGYIEPSEISREVRRMVGKNRRGAANRNVKIQKQRGVIETGLWPDFIDGGDCPQIDSEKWAIDYSHKRSRAALHKGIDIPQPRGTPILAVADGVVVGRFINRNNRKGIEVVARHTPEQTGLPFWSYSQYTHLLEMSPHPIGTAVQMGQEIGKTSNSGKMGRRIRRDALHFSIFYSESPQWSNDGKVVMPKDGYFMDPNAFYRLSPPYDSQAIRALPRGERGVAVPYTLQSGERVPQNTQRIWPYRCGQ